MNANRSTDGTSVSLSDQSVKNIEASLNKSKERKISKKQQKKTAKKVKEQSKPVEKIIPQVKIASINDIPSDFERIGTGFFRRGHHLWELMTEGDGFVLVRKSGEDHVLGYDPEPISKNASIEVTDRYGKPLEIGARVQLPHHGKIAQATVLLLSPEALDLQTDNGEQISAAPDMVQVLEKFFLEEMAEPEHQQSLGGGGIEKVIEFIEQEGKEEEHGGDEKEDSKSDKKSEGFEPEVEPSSKEATWKEFWRNAGRRIAQANPPKTPGPKTPKIPGQLTPEQKEKRRQRRKERRQMLKGLPPGTKVPPRPRTTAASDDERAKDKEYVRICQQLVDELKYVLKDEELKNQPEMLLDRVEQAIDTFDEEMETANKDDKEEMEDSLSIEKPLKEDKTLDDLRSAGKIVVSMSDL